MKLTENFTIEEAQVTKHNQFNNVISDINILENVKQIANSVMQPLRNYLGIPIIVSSWFRNPQLNAYIGGSKTSDHLTGEAVDFTCSRMIDAYMHIKNDLLFHQLIWEIKGNVVWIHVSYRRLGKNRNEAKVAVWNNKKGKYDYQLFKNISQLKGAK